VRVIALSTLKRFFEGDGRHADAREPTLAWYRHVLASDWATPAQVKRDIGSASILRDGRAVFNIAGNKYRIVVWINYPHRVVYIRFIGTHEQYDEIDAQTI
jgi:mRNA interferase HigB